MSRYEGRYPSDWTPLHVAVWNHDFAKTRSLADSSSVNIADNQGWTPVHLACAAESSFIFLSHQISRGRSEQLLSPSGKLPRGGLYYNEDEEEKAAAMRILEILLEHQPDLGGSELSVRHSRFPTPMHCAANSGWLSHARALVGAGALVYTGPSCSPLCWADGGSGGDQPVAVYLREILGENGLAMIEDDHARLAKGKRGVGDGFELSVTADRADSQMQPESRRAILAQILDRNHEAALAARLLLPFPATEIRIDSNRLCQICAGMSFKELGQPRGYVHHPVNRMQQSATLWHCRFCKVIDEVLSEDHQLDQHGASRIIIGVSNGNKSHLGVCTDPPILRALTFKISAGCTCSSSGRSRAAYSRGTLDFSECLGRCATIEVIVSIFSEKETTLMISQKLDLPNPYKSMKYAPPGHSWSIQMGSEIDLDPLSDKSVRIMQQWIDTCRSHHQHCRRDHSAKYSQNLPSTEDENTATGDVPLPSRVIDVDGSNRSLIRLRTCSGHTGKYLTLSHRWIDGPTPQWVTTQNTLESRHDWFPLASLPASVVDAVRVTRKPGLQYLWVDSLCIVQDSQDDWEFESSQMASIYANAHITIFADCGRDDNHGFLFQRQSFPSTEVVLATQDGGSVKLNIRRSSKTSYKNVQFSLFPTNVEVSYLSDRGWIFQERVLSRRIIHFGKDQIFWECNEGTFAEDGHVVLRRGQGECGQRESPFSKLAYSSTLDGPSPVSQEIFAPQWERLVKVYSTLKLTRDDDKLPALSGLAAAFHSRTQNDEYIAGIWRESLPKQLAWSITSQKPEKYHQIFQVTEYKDGSIGYSMKADNSFVHASQLSRKPNTYRAPSFSWAAVDGEIEFHYLSRPCARIGSVLLDFPSGNRFGRLKQASLLISGPLRQARSYGPLNEDLGGVFCKRKKGYIPLYDEGWPFGYLLPDSNDDLATFDIYCLKLGQEGNEAYPQFLVDIFLVLVPMQKKNTINLKFRRIGLGKTSNGETEFFSEAELKTIELV